MIRNVKIYGERNTGTIFLTKLIEKNWRVDVLPGTDNCHPDSNDPSIPGFFRDTFKQNMGWKHRVPPFREEFAREFGDATQWMLNSTLFITLTKNPYAWLISMHRRPYRHLERANWTFKAFLNTPWPAAEFEGYPDGSPTPIDLWNLKNRAHLNFNKEVPHCFNMTYETLLYDPETTLQVAGIKPGVPTQIYTMGNPAFQSVAWSTKDKSKTYESYVEYYRKELWRKHYSPELYKFVTEKLDHQLIDIYGYKIVQ